MCNAFVCEKSGKCINEHICVTSYCPYLFGKSEKGNVCEICQSKIACGVTRKEKRNDKQSDAKNNIHHSVRNNHIYSNRKHG